MPNLELTIDRFENEKAVLKTANNNTIFWPKENLPENIKEGSVLTVSIKTKEEKELEKKQLAKDILNEILSNSHE